MFKRKTKIPVWFLYFDICMRLCVYGHMYM